MGVSARPGERRGPCESGRPSTRGRTASPRRHDQRGGLAARRAKEGEGGEARVREREREREGQSPTDCVRTRRLICVWNRGAVGEHSAAAKRAAAEGQSLPRYMHCTTNAIPSSASLAQAPPPPPPRTHIPPALPFAPPARTPPPKHRPLANRLPTCGDSGETGVAVENTGGAAPEEGGAAKRRGAGRRGHAGCTWAGGQQPAAAAGPEGCTLAAAHSRAGRTAAVSMDWWGGHPVLRRSGAA